MPYQRLLTVLFLAFLAFLLWLISMANAGEPNLLFDLAYGIPHGDKFSHIVLFGMLTAGSNICSSFATISIAGINCYRGTLLTSLFVTLEELSQGFIPARTLDGGDFVANAIGISLFTYLSLRLHRQLDRRRREALLPGLDRATQ
jgi:hypothetical protein